MGDRGDVLRALSAGVLALLAAGCLDFVEPVLPERGAPAVARLAVVRTDSGALALTGTVTPGLDEAGLRRSVTDARVDAAGHIFLPADTAADRTLTYLGVATEPPNATGQPVDIRGPRISGTAAAPAVRWPGLRRADPDTVDIAPDGVVILRTEVIEPATGGGPAPTTRQWFLTLTGGGRTFRISSDGPPPAVLEVPPQFVPDPPIAARLIWQQSTTLRIGEEYVALLSLDLRLHWTVTSPEANP